ncbi:hypothetical protein [Rhizobium straminoryzae]|uniref:Uncharacterized protein n=1 Tax=Rhizobium straminoryzae TaxID=1387186 RepID=A0A549TD20_9HYPH|nr:hypothetical protein [Rhizobium straminoryzae]TRL39820.1 hypothetical protein FNA46_07745 [Rhizobium straminoryzae]
MTRIVIAAGIILAIGLVLAATYHQGQRQEQAATAAANARALTEQIKDRSLIDDQVNRMSVSDLCAGLGGVWRDGTCQ